MILFTDIRKIKLFQAMNPYIFYLQIDLIQITYKKQWQLNIYIWNNAPLMKQIDLEIWLSLVNKNKVS